MKVKLRTVARDMALFFLLLTLCFMAAFGVAPLFILLVPFLVATAVCASGPAVARVASALLTVRKRE